jgi:diguanylate cyclase (GGDEF)-like protein
MKAPAMTAHLDNRLGALDPFFVDEAARGELIVARIRLAVVAAATMVLVVAGDRGRAGSITLTLGGCAMAVAFCLYLLARRAYQPWLSTAASAIDVTLVSAGLAVGLLVDGPERMAGSRGLFDGYFVAIAAATLRYSWQLAFLTGSLAAVEYAALVVWAGVGAPGPRGAAEVGAPLLRLMFLAAATLVATILVLGAHRLRRLSTTDRLTGVLNRGAFDERLVAEASRARRHDRPLTVALVDVDQFKRFNDAHGHAGGDVVLRVLADTLVASVRRSDIVARYGGEEFALVLPETTATAAMGRLETLRRIVAATPIDPGQGTGPVHVTVSVGVAGWPEDGAEISDVLARADSRLFDAKRRGRDRTAGPEPIEARRSAQDVTS